MGGLEDNNDCHKRTPPCPSPLVLRAYLSCRASLAASLAFKSKGCPAHHLASAPPHTIDTPSHHHKGHLLLTHTTPHTPHTSTAPQTTQPRVT